MISVFGCVSVCLGVFGYAWVCARVWFWVCERVCDCVFDVVCDWVLFGVLLGVWPGV